MEEEFKSRITKEFYKAQIESAANNLIKRADDILEDWDKGVRTIHFDIDINPCSNAIISITKEYNPREVSKNA